MRRERAVNSAGSLELRTWIKLSAPLGRGIDARRFNLVLRRLRSILSALEDFTMIMSSV